MSASGTAGSMYVRVKRANQTVFMHAEPHDSVAHLKAKVGAVLRQPPADMLLYFRDAALTDEAKSLAELNIENDNILYVVFRVGGQWEPLSKGVVPPPPEPR